MQSDRPQVGFIQVLVHFKGVGFVVELGDKSPMERRKKRTFDIHHRAMHLRDRSDLGEVLGRARGSRGHRGRSVSGRHGNQVSWDGERRIEHNGFLVYDIPSKLGAKGRLPCLGQQDPVWVTWMV